MKAMDKKLQEVIAALNLEVSDINKTQHKDNPRYTNFICITMGGDKWFIKLVNDNFYSKNSNITFEGIKDCCEYNNCVHKRLHKSSRIQSIIKIPRYKFSQEHIKTMSCAEYITGVKPNSFDIPLLVKVLLNLNKKRYEIRAELERLNDLAPNFRPIYTNGRREYKERLIYVSGKELVYKKILNNKELSILSEQFDNLIPEEKYNIAWWEEHLTFVHGDFSLDNVIKMADDTICFIDFEHSHIGLGLIDLAHLYVNLLVDRDKENAGKLLSLYKAQDTSFDVNVFNALVLERAAGKLNSVNAHAGTDKTQILRSILLNHKIRSR